jgi:hypothetical protein
MSTADDHRRCETVPDSDTKLAVKIRRQGLKSWRVSLLEMNSVHREQTTEADPAAAEP